MAAASTLWGWPCNVTRWASGRASAIASAAVECAGREVRFEVVRAGRAGNEQYVRRVAEQPGEADLRRGAAQRFSGGENGRFVGHLAEAGSTA
jgi:hypothetical protein